MFEASREIEHLSGGRKRGAYSYRLWTKDEEGGALAAALRIAYLGMGEQKGSTIVLLTI